MISLFNRNNFFHVLFYFFISVQLLTLWDQFIPPSIVIAFLGISLCNAHSFPLLLKALSSIILNVFFCKSHLLLGYYFFRTLLVKYAFMGSLSVLKLILNVQLWQLCYYYKNTMIFWFGFHFQLQFYQLHLVYVFSLQPGLLKFFKFI